MFKRLCLLFCVCSAIASAPLHAQVAAASTGNVPHLWVGGEYSNFNPDWNFFRLPGLGIYADLSVYRRYGLEGEARFLNFTKPDGLTEKSLLIGPYGTVYQWHGLSANLKFLGGIGFVTYTGGIGYGSYFEFAPGGNVEYRISHRLKARFDYEHQFMPSAPGLPGIASHGLTPTGYSGGASYRIF